MPTEAKLIAMHKSVGITPPIKIIEILGLQHKQRTLIYVDNDKINIRAMEPGEPKPSYLCWIRKISRDPTKRFLIIPSKILKMFHLKAGDYVRLGLGEARGQKIFMLKPARPTMHIRVKYDGNSSVIEIYKLTHDGKLDTSQAPIIKKVPYEKAYEIEKSLEEKDREKLEKELEASKPLDIAVGPDYVPEVFANDKEAKPTAIGKEDASGTL